MDTRDRLLDSAEAFARTRGYDAFSFADLADEVGVRKASVHHHFPRKADLALALVQRYCAAFAATLAAVAEASDTGAARLRGYLRAYRDALRGGSCLCLCVAFSAGRDSLSEPVLDELRGFDADAAAWLERAFELGAADGSVDRVRSPSDESAATRALVEGAQLIARAAGDLSRFDAAVRTLTARFQEPDMQ